MAQEVTDGADELKQLKRRFEEFRGTQTRRGRLPETLWKEAAESAKRYGLNPVAQALRLDYSRLKQRIAATSSRERGKQKREKHAAPAFVEWIGSAPGGGTDCHMEVESQRGGKLRLELKSIRAAELAELIRAFVGQ